MHSWFLSINKHCLHKQTFNNNVDSISYQQCGQFLSLWQPELTAFWRALEEIFYPLCTFLHMWCAQICTVITTYKECMHKDSMIVSVLLTLCRIIYWESGPPNTNSSLTYSLTHMQLVLIYVSNTHTDRETDKLLYWPH